MSRGQIRRSHRALGPLPVGVFVLTRSMFFLFQKVNDVPVIKCPLTPLFDVDEVSLLAAITSTTKIVFLCSPGNPTAKSIPLAVRAAALTRWT